MEIKEIINKLVKKSLCRTLNRRFVCYFSLDIFLKNENNSRATKSQKNNEKRKKTILLSFLKCNLHYGTTQAI